MNHLSKLEKSISRTFNPSSTFIHKKIIIQQKPHTSILFVFVLFLKIHITMLQTSTNKRYTHHTLPTISNLSDLKLRSEPHRDRENYNKYISINRHLNLSHLSHNNYLNSPSLEKTPSKRTLRRTCSDAFRPGGYA